MAREFSILEDNKKDWIFYDGMNKVKSSKKYISYRHIICHALLHYIKFNYSPDINLIKIMLEDFYACFNDNKNCTVENFLSLYNIDYPTKITIVVDASNGCYPLILDQERKIAFDHSLLNIKEKIDNIGGYLIANKRSEWTKELQEYLETFHDYSKDLML